MREPEIDLVGFRLQAQRITDMIRWLSHTTRKPPRGTPGGLSADRRLLGLSVALRLRAAGFRLTKGRDGVLARTLTILFEVAELGAPEDMFDSVRDLLDRLKALDEQNASKGGTTA